MPKSGSKTLVWLKSRGEGRGGGGKTSAGAFEEGGVGETFTAFCDHKFK